MNSNLTLCRHYIHPTEAKNNVPPIEIAFGVAAPIVLCVVALIMIVFFVVWSKKPHSCLELYAENTEDADCGDRDDYFINMGAPESKRIYSWRASSAI